MTVNQKNPVDRNTDVVDVNDPSGTVTQESKSDLDLLFFTGGCSLYLLESRQSQCTSRNPTRRVECRREKVANDMI